MANKLVVFEKGRTFNCYLNISREEATKRYNKIQEQKNDLELKLEEGQELKVHEFEFDDHFEIFPSEDLANYASLCIEEALKNVGK